MSIGKNIQDEIAKKGRDIASTFLLLTDNEPTDYIFLIDIQTQVPMQQGEIKIKFWKDEND